MPRHPEGETHGIAASDRTVLAKAVRLFDFSQMRARLALNRIHEELRRFLSVVPCHAKTP